MRVTVVRGGGVAGITTRTRLDSESLPPADVPTLSSFVQGAALQHQPPPAPMAPGADDLLYEISVDDGANQVTQRFTDATLPDDVRRLVEWVDARPERSYGLDT